jgi:signal transduction histidine kinase/DNA-binding response OmpR family regulator
MDPRTAFILATAFAMLNGGILGLMHRGRSTEIRPAAIDWRIGTLLAAGGTILLAAQSPDSAWLVLPLGNASLFFGFTLYWRSVRRFDRIPDSNWLFAPAIVVTLILTFFTLIYPILWIRVVVAAIGWAIAMLYSAYSLLRHRESRHEIGRITLAGIFLLLTSFMIFRAFYFALMMRDINSILASDNIINVLTPLSASILPVIGTTAFLVMCSERLRGELALRAVELNEKNVALTRAILAREDAERIARHDLKTPLASIAATPDLIRANQAQEPEQEALLSMIENAAQRALNMVNLSLDLYRMENGSYEFVAENVDLAAICWHAMEDMHAHARSKQVTMQFVGGDAPVFAAASAPLCYSCIANILKNAVEAASDRSVVTLTLAVDEHVLLRIHNDTAVPMNLRANFFEKYATQGKPGGSGLGTYSSHTLAAVQGGNLSMTTSESEGTTLHLQLNRYQSVLSFEEYKSSTPLVSRVTPQAETPEVVKSEIIRDDIKILVVDDDVYNRKVLSGQLSVFGLQVRAALNGRYAIDCCLEYRPDLIFMDIEMPVMNGVQAMQAIRDLQKARRQRPSMIVTFSSDDGVESQARFLALGFNQCVSKPTSQTRLRQLLSALPPTKVPSPQELEPVKVHVNLLPDIAEFVASRLQLLDELEQAALRKDSQLAAKLAHQLNGSLAMYGFKPQPSNVSE